MASGSQSDPNAGLLPVPQLDPSMSPDVQGVLAAPPPQAPQPQSGVLGGIGALLGGVAKLPGEYVNKVGSDMLASIAQNQFAQQQQQAAIIEHQNAVAALSKRLAGYQEQRDSLIASGDKKNLALFDSDPEGYTKTITGNLALQNVKGGDSLINSEGVGPTAPVVGMSKDGVGYTQTPTRTTLTGSLPTIQDKAAGNLISPLAPVGPAAATVGGGQPLGGTPSLATPASAAIGNSQSPSATPNPMAPRGIRNNNWLNLTSLPKGQQWAGQTGVDKDGYATFVTPQAGLAAAAKNLQSYATLHGINTLAGIANRWTSTDKGAWAANAGKAMGVGVNDPLDMTNPQVINGILHGGAIAENGAHAVNAALAAGPTPVATGALPAQGQATAPSIADAAPSATGAFGYPTSLAATPYSAPGMLAGHSVQTGPDGKVDVGPALFDTDANRGKFNELPEVAQYNTALGPYMGLTNALTAMSKNNGALDTATMDAFLQNINPKVSPRQNTVKMVLDHFGLPADVESHVSNVVGNGYVTPDTMKDMLTVMRSYLQAHHDIAQGKANDLLKTAAAYQVTPDQLGINVPPVPPAPSIQFGRPAAASSTVPTSGVAAMTPAQLQALAMQRGFTRVNGQWVAPSR